MADTIERPSRALVVTAHPDDEIGCAGTIAKWTREGTEVLLVVCTNGDKGTEDPDMSPETLAGIRAKEQQDAADALGIRELVMLKNPDGGLEDTRELRGDLVRQVRRWRPEVVLCHEYLFRARHSHRDHRVSGQAVVDALFPYARDPHHFGDITREGHLPHKVGTALFWGSEDPTVFVDIEDAMDTKVKAMLCHASQFLRPGRDPNREPGEFMRMGAQRTGELAGVAFAEGFRKLEFRT
jgi:LmbE family N-acetylglucosaminyl deacetylase